MISKYYKRIKRNLELKFSDILKSTELIRGTAGRIRKLRLHLIDNTFVDIWYSPDGSYSYHWEQRNIRNAIYRHDNAPHKKWRNGDKRDAPKNISFFSYPHGNLVIDELTRISYSKNL